MAKAIAVNVNEVADTITMEMKLTGLRRFRARLWCAAQILRLAAFVAGVKSEVEVQIR